MPGLLVPGVPPPPIIPLKFPTFKLGLGKSSIMLRKQPKRYQPSLGAILTGRTARRIPKGYGTGLTLRPMIIGGKPSKKRKKAWYL